MKEDKNRIIQGDCIEKMKELGKTSVDAVVTDPPYGLAFMGKDWDAFNPKEFQQFSRRWGEQVLRVLKPGGYLLGFCGTRTYHRMVVGLEDAGFEIRDQIMWVYGTGFPKSTSISKQIDKHGGKNIGWFADKLKRARKEKELSQKDIAKHFLSKTGGITGCVHNWEEGKNLPTPEQFNKLCDILDLPYEDLEEAEREVVGKKETNKTVYQKIGKKNESGKVEVTKAETPEAKQWEGWGTALKPAHEPIVVAQAPCDGTYAENVLNWGTGGLNIDGCRISLDGDDTSRKITPESKNIYGEYGEMGSFTNDWEKGRWPANVILDPQAAQVLDRQSGESVSSGGRTSLGFGNTDKYGDGKTGYKKIDPGFGDKGGASRFFYSSKAHKSERNAGLEDLEDGKYNDHYGVSKAKWQKERGRNPENYEPPKNDIATLKPINLIRYLTRLITPPNGVVLDPFTGSGTTGCAAVIEGFNYILIEKRERFANVIAPKRIEHWSNPNNWGMLKDHAELPDPNTRLHGDLSKWMN